MNPARIDDRDKPDAPKTRDAARDGGGGGQSAVAETVAVAVAVVDVTSDGSKGGKFRAMPPPNDSQNGLFDNSVFHFPLPFFRSFFPVG